MISCSQDMKFLHLYPQNIFFMVVIVLACLVILSGNSSSARVVFCRWSCMCVTGECLCRMIGLQLPEPCAFNSVYINFLAQGFHKWVWDLHMGKCNLRNSGLSLRIGTLSELISQDKQLNPDLSENFPSFFSHYEVTLPISSLDTPVNQMAYSPIHCANLTSFSSSLWRCSFSGLYTQLHFSPFLSVSQLYAACWCGYNTRLW